MSAAVPVSLPLRGGVDARRVRGCHPALGGGLPVRLDGWVNPPVLGRALDAAASGWDAPVEGAPAVAAERLAALLGAPCTHRVVPVRGVAEAVRVVARAWAGPRLRAGDEVLLTESASHATLVAFQQVARATGASLRFLPFRGRGRVTPEDVDDAITSRTRLLCLTHCSPVLGTLLPVAELAESARVRQVPVLVDGSAAAAALPVDLALLDCDFYAVDGPPLGAPPGTGALVLHRERLHQVDPGELPGGAEVVDLRWSRAAPSASGVDALAPAGPLCLALAAAADFRTRLGPFAVRRHASGLTRRLLGGLSRLRELRVFGPGAVEERGASVAFAPFDRPPRELARQLARLGIAVSCGHHESMPLHRRLELEETCLAWVGPYTLPDEVDALVEGLSRILVRG